MTECRITVSDPLLQEIPIGFFSQTSTVGWIIRIMSPLGAFAVLIDVVLFFGAIVLVSRTDRVAVLAAYLLFVPVPALIAFGIALRSIALNLAVVPEFEVEMNQFQIISSIVEPIALFCAATVLSIPTYLIVTIAIFIRVLRHSPKADQ